MNTDFIEFLAKSGAVKFGEFTLKSGRQSPFFISTGVLCDGATSYELGRHFARKINEVYGNNIDAVYGPAYKGIPLVVAVSIALQKEFSINKPWIFDRKEKKTYGDISAFVGAALDINARVVVVDDVFTTGETKMEAVDKIERIIKAKVVGIVIAVDRQEKGVRLGAIEEFTNKTGVPVHSVTTIKDVFDHLKNRTVEGKVYVSNKTYEMFIDYRKKYGI
ncbi:orotate phosphoribosyltransferase [Candidatus Micrarchaeota archaeon]|nr:orotate phosphoribosyltransferase [Candidatus Micrarchaeota archaeon]